MYLILAAHNDQVAAGVHELLMQRHGAARAMWLTPEDLAQAIGWTYYPSAAAAQHSAAERSWLRLGAGRRLGSAELAVVFNRVHDINLPQFARASEADRGYARSEFFALLLSWLAELPCPVINPPKARSLCSVPATLFDALQSAARAGVAVPKMRFTTDPRCFAVKSARNRAKAAMREHRWEPAFEASLRDLALWRCAPQGRSRAAPTLFANVAHHATRRALFIGGQLASSTALSRDDTSLIQSCERLARQCNLDLVECRFACVLPVGPEQTTEQQWKLTQLDPFPQRLTQAELLRLADLLESRAATAPPSTTERPTPRCSARKRRVHLLFGGVPSEPPLQRALQAAQAAGIRYTLFNQREWLGAEMQLALRAGSLGGELRLPTERIALAAFSGSYLRLMDWQYLPQTGGRRAEAARAKSRLLHEALSVWADLTPSRVCNRPAAMASNFSKPYQAQFIERCGLHTPPTLITNEPAAAREFLREHKRVVYKSTSSVRSIVREVGPVELTRLDKLRHLPTQFQAFIAGENVRVHVVGEQLFATRIVSEAVDYRYAQRDGMEVSMQPFALPDDVAQRCLALALALDLPFCGIDLKRTPEGCYYCFEVNPSPAYTYYQLRTEQPIAEALVQWLAGARH